MCVCERERERERERETDGQTDRQTDRQTDKSYTHSRMHVNIRARTHALTHAPPPHAHTGEISGGGGRRRQDLVEHGASHPVEDGAGVSQGRDFKSVLQCLVKLAVGLPSVCTATHNAAVVRMTDRLTAAAVSMR